VKRPREMNGSRNEKEEQGQRMGENTKKRGMAAWSCRCFIAGGFVVLTDTCAEMWMRKIEKREGQE